MGVGVGVRVGVRVAVLVGVEVGAGGGASGGAGAVVVASKRSRVDAAIQYVGILLAKLKNLRVIGHSN